MSENKMIADMNIMSDAEDGNTVKTNVAEVRYEDSGIDDRILRAVKEMGFEMMTPIQAQAIPVMMSGKDLIGQAQTGTGKTAAFGIPLLQLVEPEDKSLQAIVLCPTRELAIQAACEIRGFAKFMHGIKVLPVYGGQEISKQIRSLKSDVQIVVGTPGRVMDHMRRHTIKMENIRMVVLDEADEMLNMGFREDIETILKKAPEERQTALFSATMPKPILEITKNYQKKDAVLIKIVKKELTIPLVKQYYYEVPKGSKEEVVCRLLDYYNPKRSLIFCNTKRMVDELTEHLKGRGYFAEGLHGDLSQNQRDTVMNLFRGGNVDILIATDVAARGIDVDDVEAVFNYDVPQDIEYYVHRIGRTGRAGRSGRSFTLVVGREIYKIREIEQTCKTKIKARSIPSAADVTALKADKILGETVEVMRSQDISKMRYIIEQKLEDEECTAIDLAAAFLKNAMGEELKDIVVQKRDKGDRSKAGERSRGKEGRRRRHGDDADKYNGRKNGRKEKGHDKRVRGSWEFAEEFFRRETGKKQAKNSKNDKKKDKQQLTDARLYKDVDIHGNAKKKKKTHK